jgi:Flp pilus assembly protein TadB
VTALPAALAVGFGLLLAFDGLTRPVSRSMRFLGRHTTPQVAGGGIGAAAAYALTGWPIGALAGAVLGIAVPRLLTEHRSVAKRIELTDALADAAAGLRDAVRGGLGLSDGISGLSHRGPPLLREHLASLVADTGRIGLAAAARRFAERLDDPGADLLAVTLAFNDRVGGRQVAEVLDAMADELAAEARTVRELRARQERQRTSARVVALAPVVLLLLLQQVNPGYLDPYGSPAGQSVLGLAALLIGVGYGLMLRIARGIDPPRVVVGGER